jgi:hypothetical protein
MGQTNALGSGAIGLLTDVLSLEASLHFFTFISFDDWRCRWLKWFFISTSFAGSSSNCICLFQMF